MYAAKKVFVPGKDHMPYVKREIENLLYVAVEQGSRTRGSANARDDEV